MGWRVLYAPKGVLSREEQEAIIERRIRALDAFIKSDGYIIRQQVDDPETVAVPVKRHQRRRRPERVRPEIRMAWCDVCRETHPEAIAAIHMRTARRSIKAAMSSMRGSLNDAQPPWMETWAPSVPASELQLIPTMYEDGE